MINKMLSFIDEMHKSTGYSELDYNRDKTELFFNEIIKHEQFIYLTRECLMIGTIDKPFFGNSLISSDVLLYVKKDYRGCGHAVKAVSDFIEWSDSQGADRVVMGQSTGVCGVEFNSLVESCGFTKIGEVFAR